MVKKIGRTALRSCFFTVYMCRWSITIHPGGGDGAWLRPRTCVKLTIQPDAKTRQVAVSGSGCSFLGLQFGPRPATS